MHHSTELCIDPLILNLTALKPCNLSLPPCSPVRFAVATVLQYSEMHSTVQHSAVLYQTSQPGVTGSPPPRPLTAITPSDHLSSSLFLAAFTSLALAATHPSLASLSVYSSAASKFCHACARTVPAASAPISIAPRRHARNAETDGYHHRENHRIALLLHKPLRCYPSLKGMAVLAPPLTVHRIAATFKLPACLS